MRACLKLLIALHVCYHNVLGAIRASSSRRSDGVGFRARMGANVTPDYGELENVAIRWPQEKMWIEDIPIRASFGPIMDYTWGMLPTFITGNDAKYLGDLNLLNEFELNFSFLGKSNAQIRFCTANGNECFAILLGRKDNRESVLQRCDPLNQCEGVTLPVSHPPLFSKDYWSQITVALKDREFRVIVNDALILSFVTWRTEEFDVYSKLYIQSETEASWKYHNYTYYSSLVVRVPCTRDCRKFLFSKPFSVPPRHLCVSLFANFDKSITLKLFNMNNNLMGRKTYTKGSEKWQHIKFYASVNSSGEGKHYLEISMDLYDIVSLRNIVIHRRCNGTDFDSDARIYAPHFAAPRPRSIDPATFQIEPKLTLEEAEQNFLKIVFKNQSQLRNSHDIPFADIYAQSYTSLSVRWSQPDPPVRKLNLVKMQYSNNNNAETTFMIKDFTTCDIWEDMFCATLNNLTPDREYNVSISGFDEDTNIFGSVINLHEKTTIAEPEPPLHVQGYWNASLYLVLKWQHPNRTHGPFEKFRGLINGVYFDYRVKPNHTYTYETNVRCTLQNHTASFSLQTINSKYPSVQLNGSVACPVFKPTFVANPELTRINNHSLTIFLPPIQDVEEHSNLYIVLKKQKFDINLHTLLLDDEEKGLTTWTLARFNKTQYFNIANREIEVRFFEFPEFNFKTEMYKIEIIILNERDNQTHYTFYPLYTSIVKGTKVVLHQSIFYNYWWAILTISILVVICIGALVWKVRSENKCSGVLNCAEEVK